MNKLIITFALVVAACGKDSATKQCEEIYDHTVAMMPDLAEQLAKTKDKAIDKCKQMSEDARKCALDAKSMADLASCPRK